MFNNTLEIANYYKTHTVKETSEKFNVSETSIQAFYKKHFGKNKIRTDKEKKVKKTLLQRIIDFFSGD